MNPGPRSPRSLRRAITAATVLSVATGTVTVFDLPGVGVQPAAAQVAVQLQDELSSADVRKNGADWEASVFFKKPMDVRTVTFDYVPPQTGNPKESAELGDPVLSIVPESWEGVVQHTEYVNNRTKFLANYPVTVKKSLGKSDSGRNTIHLEYELPPEVTVKSGDRLALIAKGQGGMYPVPMLGGARFTKATVSSQSQTGFEVTAKPGSVRGSVRDLPANSTISVVAARNGYQETKPVTDGSFEFPSLEPGFYSITATNVPHGYTIASLPRIEVKPGEPAEAQLVATREKRTVSGSVNDLPSGGAATVRLIGADALTSGQEFVAENVNGSFSIPNVPTGRYDVRVDALTGYSFASTPQVTVNANGNTPETVTVNGRRDTGVLVVGLPSVPVDVRVQGPDGFDETYRGRSGSLRLDNRATGQYTVTVTDPAGYSVKLTNGVNPVEVKKNQTASVQFGAERVNGSVSVRVANLPSEKKVTVRLVGADALTSGREYVAENVNGSFSMPNVPTGTYDVKVDALTGYSFTSTPQVTVNANGNTPETVTVDAKRDVYSFGGTVENAPANAALKVRLTAPGETLREASVQNGRFSFQNVPTAEYKVELVGAPQGYSVSGPAKVNVTKTGVDPAELKFSLSEDAGSITGKVVDQTGKRIDGATAELQTRDGRRVRDLPINNAGEINASDVAPGQYTVVVALPGKFDGPVKQDVEIRAGGNVELKPVPVVRSTKSFGGTVENVPANSNLRVRLSATGEATREALVANGKFSFANVPTAKYSIQLVGAPQGYSVSGPSSVDVTKDGINPAELKFSLSEDAGSITGKVVGTDGKPVDGASAELQTRDGKFVRDLPINNAGAINASDVAPGQYTVVVNLPEKFDGPVSQDIEVRAGGNVELKPVSVVRSTRSFGGTVANVPANADLKVRLSAAGEATQEVSVRDGKFAFQNVPTANYSIQLVGAPQGYSVTGPSSVDATKDGVDPAELAFSLSEDAGSITGKVVDQNGDPVKGAKATLTTRDGKVVRALPINAAGEIKVTDVVPGQYTVVVVLPEQFDGPVSQDVKIRAGGNVELKPVSVVRSTKSFGGTVENVPANAALKVRLSAPNEVTREASVQNGRFSFDKVPTAEYKVELVGAPQGYSVSGPQKVNVTKNGIDPQQVNYMLTAPKPVDKPAPAPAQDNYSWDAITVVPGEVRISAPERENHDDEGVTFATESVDGRRPDGTRIEIAPDQSWLTVERNGTVVARPPADAPAGTYQVTVVASTGERDSVTVVVPEAPNMAQRYAAAVEAVSVPAGATRRTARPRATLRDGEFTHLNQPLPSGTTFEVDYPDARVDQNGRVTFAAGKDLKPQQVNIPVAVTYPDGSSSNFTAVFNVTDPLLATQAPISYPTDASVRVGQMNAIQVEGTVPEGTTFVLDDGAALGGWMVTVDAKTGRIRATPPSADAKPVTVTVTAFYNDGSWQQFETTLTAARADDETSGEADKFTFGVAQAQVGESTTIKPAGTIPEGTRFALGEFNQRGWDAQIDPATGALTVTTNDSVPVGETVTVPVVISQPDGSVRTVEVQARAVDKQKPAETAGSSTRDWLIVLIGALVAVGGLTVALAMNEREVRRVLEQFGITW